MRRSRSSLVLVLAVVAWSALLAACFHDFDSFDPLPSSGGDDGGATNGANDAGGDVAQGSTDDAQSPLADGSPQTTIDASGCGADCRIEAKACSGTCAEIEQSCAAACDGGSACVTACTTKEGTCASNCATTCETCTSGAGCIDQTGCQAAAL